MKIALICKSDATGGAAVVTFRLMNALRAKGIDARMIVAEKRTDSPWVIKAAPDYKIKSAFIRERLKIYMANGFNRSTLFQVDTASVGLPLHHIPFIKDADVICLNWINQGLMSLRGIRKLAALGKPIVWTMHDMWNMTGICHHAGYCLGFLSPDGTCRRCPLLTGKVSCKTMARKIWKAKKKLYDNAHIRFVAVSNWLAESARKSSLMKDAGITVIPNAFPIKETTTGASSAPLKRIIFGAARIDDPIKGHETLVKATRILKNKYPEEAGSLELVTFGSLKNPEALKDVAIAHTHLGRISPQEIKEVYSSGIAVVSTSEWETLPGTLIEGQAWGCVPVTLNHGGQPDIIDHLRTGYLAPWSDSEEERASSIADGIIWASHNAHRLKEEMQKSVRDRFSEEAVAKSYIRLFENCLTE